MFDTSVVEASSAVLPEAGSSLVAVLDDIDVAAARIGGLLTGLEACRRLAAWNAAHEARLLAELQTRQDAVSDPDDREWLGDEVGAVLRVAGGIARTQMMHAAELIRRLPRTLELLSAGLITAVQARDLSEAIGALSNDAVTEVETRVLVRAPDQTNGQFRVSMRRAVLAAAPVLAEQAHADSVDERRFADSRPSTGCRSCGHSYPLRRQSGSKQR